ncbi:hypothetical protein NO2A_01646 [Planktothrix agardhii]|nr:hypothetical protein NO2A_01646 [Planktothrix agardhii]
MSQHHNNKFSNPILSLSRSIRIAFQRMTRRTMRSLLRVWMRINRQDRYGRAGFVLPTVVMVLLVVVLLTITIMLRSMDRAKMAQYRRVDEQVLQAATPALDRASAKIDYLLNQDKSLPVATPSDDELYRALNNISYQFKGEDVLSIQIATDLTKTENFSNTTWRFPVDTNNDGTDDSYVLYGIYFRLPKTARARIATEARTPPMKSIQSQTKKCASAGSSADLIDGSGWSKQDGKLKKSFFVYTTTVPMPDANGEVKGTSGFTALEYQQDRTRIPFTNNAVVYEDDLEVAPGPAFRLNGRMFTNSNLITTPGSSNAIRYYLVSSPASCFYEIENSKIIVGGNVVNGTASDSTKKGSSTVDLFKAATSFTEPKPTISSTDRSTTQEAADVLYNNNAYENRISLLVASQLTNGNTTDPDSVKNAIKTRTDQDATLDPTKAREEELETYFRERTRRVPYIEAPVGTSGLDPDSSATLLFGSGNSLRPTDTWAMPFKPTDPKTSLTGITLKEDQLKAQEPPDNPENEVELGDRVLVGNNQPKLLYTGKTSAPFFEAPKATLGTWTGTNPPKARERPTQIQTLPNVGTIDRHGFWEKAATQKPDPIISGYGGLRVVTGAGIYERSSSFLPPPAWDDPATASVDESKYGGTYPIVWPDTMPMSPTKWSKVFNNEVTKDWIDIPGWPLTTTNSAAPTGSLDPNTPKYAKGDLKMRATAVYHYAQDIFDPEKSDTTQQPIACISSYYDPSNRLTSLNTGDFPLSNNGKVYGPPTTSRPGASTITAGLLGGTSPTILENQANLVFPDGRFVNERLRNALTEPEAKRDLGDQSAIDSALCALGILGTTGYNLGSVPSATTFPEGAIKETAFLNAREVKAVETDNTATPIDETFTVRDPSDPTKITGELTPSSDPSNPTELPSYAMPLENRFPQEIRATVIDLGVLRNQPITIATTGPSPEYLLPNSGIIYATRDDALPDLSDKDPNTTVRGSASDFKLDPSRRPNGIVLVNGKYLARNDKDNNGQNDTALPADAKQATEKILQEKGLILVSDVPVYIKGEFNLHNAKDGKQIQEFKESLNATWSNFYTRKTLNTDFACRPGDPRLKPNCTSATGGDTWRPATVLADAVTLLSDNFRFGFRNEGDFDLRNNAGNAKIGYDLNGDGEIKFISTDPATATTELAFADTNDDKTINNNEFWIDLNGNGVFDGPKTAMVDDVETLLPPTPIKEIDITANAARIINGFNQSNNFVTNGLSSGAFSQTLDANKNPQLIGSASDLRISDSHYLAINTTAVDSSYFNNFVTPIQRRVQFSEYVMEVCRKVPISACGPNDWTVGYDAFADTTATKDNFTDNVPLLTGNKKEIDLTLYDLLVEVPKVSSIPNNYGLTNPGDRQKFRPTAMFSGTTGYWRITEESQRLPRRVGFLRDQKGMIRLDQMNRPIIVGIADPGNGAGADVKNGWLQCYVSADVTTPDYQYPAGGEYRHRVDPNEPDLTKNYLCPKLGDTVGGQVQEPRSLNPNNNEAVPPLWFVTNNNGVRNYGYQYPLWFYNPRTPGAPVTLTHGKPQQPLLIPVLQLHATDKTPTATEAKNFSDFPVGSILGEEGKAQSRWLIPAKTGTTTYNLVLGSGNGPSRPTESNGGLENFPRLIENWVSGTAGTRGTVQILGSFIQIRRSRYATAPAIPLQLETDKYDKEKNIVTAPGMFGVSDTKFSDVYNFNNVDRRVSYYTPSVRNWGFDVGILSQPPDLFAQKFTAPSTEAPDNYFREVSRDDEWVKYLLCSKVADPTAINDPTKATTNAVANSIRNKLKCET